MTTYSDIKEACQQMNALGASGTPFVFLIDYEMKKIVISQNLEDQSVLQYAINGVTNTRKSAIAQVDSYYFDKFPMSIEDYQIGFDQVVKQIKLGNSFLLNLSYPTKVVTNLSLEDIYGMTSAKYKIHLKDRFVCYSPEIFVQIKDGRISSNPMKGTIDASLEGARDTILNDPKETAEHYTIVDLIRNDLSRVAKQVRVDRFRYIDELTTNDKTLLQVSSEISGVLPEDYTSKIGDILFELLPAGSITGAPKVKTVEVISNAEGQDRGYYTGICGIFDGRDLDSGVMIRLIEARGSELLYRSGCGITAMSDLETEYQEMIDKVYLPIQSDQPDLEFNENIHANV